MVVHRHAIARQGPEESGVSLPLTAGFQVRYRWMFWYSTILLNSFTPPPSAERAGQASVTGNEISGTQSEHVLQACAESWLESVQANRICPVSSVNRGVAVSETATIRRCSVAAGKRHAGPGRAPPAKQDQIIGTSNSSANHFLLDPDSVGCRNLLYRRSFICSTLLSRQRNNSPRVKSA
jgi:hypothetical protein